MDVLGRRRESMHAGGGGSLERAEQSPAERLRDCLALLGPEASACQTRNRRSPTSNDGIQQLIQRARGDVWPSGFRTLAHVKAFTSFPDTQH